PGTLHCCRNLGCHPAPGWDEGQQGDRGDQQGRGSAHLPGRRLRPGGRSVRGIAGAGKGTGALLTMNIEVKPTQASGTLLAEPPVIASVGVIGAGQMGNGIAHVCALAGLPVTLLDVKAEPLKKAMATIARNMERQVNRSLISSEERDDALARISITT